MEVDYYKMLSYLNCAHFSKNLRDEFRQLYQTARLLLRYRYRLDMSDDSENAW